MTTFFYFAAQYDRHPEMREYKVLLESKLDVEVTSRWINPATVTEEADVIVEDINTNPSMGWRFGKADLDDINNSDVLVCFNKAGGGGRGGRHIEYGYALGLGYLRIVIIGPRENVFHCYPEAEIYDDFQHFYAHELQEAGA